MPKGLAIIMFSGQAENFIPLAVLTQTAANMELPVRIYVTGFALPYFTKYKPEPRFSKEFEDMVPKLMQGVKKLNMPNWDEVVKEAKELGDVKVYACSLTSEAFGLKKEDMDPIVDDIVGAAYFVGQLEDYQIIFI